MNHQASGSDARPTRSPIVWLDTMNHQASGSDAMASIAYLLDRADSCRRKARRSSDEAETGELLRTADSFTSLAHRVAGGDERAPQQDSL